MGLRKYKAKRKLSKTHEPLALKKASSSKLAFCIQKHAARSLHYDFRLEHKGVLLSWAVPKGPSEDPREKRLAIKVEDHPLDYQYFEGVIPKGHYGAGTVEIWDKGTYSIPGMTDPKEIEKAMQEGLKKGHIDIELHGDKLNGEYVLQYMKGAIQENAWLLIKKKDAFSSSPAKKKDPIKKTKMPSSITPMLGTLIKEPFDDEDWIFEIKWDGYRALSFVDDGKVQIKSRNMHAWNEKFPTVVKALQKISGKVILDGELVVLDADGRSDFQLMQNFQKNSKGVLRYYVFDLLYKDVEDLKSLPLIERKELLAKLIDELSSPLILLSEHIPKKGIAFFQEAKKMQLEGIMGKRIASTYQPRRSSDWVKIKASQGQEVVIGGFTAPKGSRKKFGALLVGYYEGKDLVYAGHVGGGFDEALLKEIYEKLKPLAQKNSPFKQATKPNAPVTWVKPLIVCEVSFAEWTKEGMLRQPIFKGLRVDKDPKKVKREIFISPSIDPKSSKKSPFTNLSKIYWPKEKYTKGDLIEYYKKAAPFILPHLKDRPITLHRYPDGIGKEGFYQKEIEPYHPKWVKTIPIHHDNKTINYLLINNMASLLYAINLGSIDLHPFLSRYQHLENPDFCVLDLDPQDISFDKVVETALVAHEILDELKIKHLCKTSGGRGLHIYIPLQAKYTFGQSRQFAELIAHCIHHRLPKITSLIRDPKKRQKRVYLDYLQNVVTKSVAAPYSVRPHPQAPISTPLLWEEVKKGLDPKKFNIKTLPKRLKEKGDLFKPILKSGINIKSSLSRLEKLLI